MENVKVLIVEDNPDNRKLIAWILEDHGYPFVSVTNAEEAFLRLDQETFDLVLMDISLPGIDGKEATRRLRADARYRDLPIIAVTAHAVQGEKEAILQSGVNALVTKPIDETEFVSVLTKFRATRSESR